MKKLIFLLLISVSIFAQTSHYRDTVMGFDTSLTSVKIYERFNYDSDLESERNWWTGTGAYEVQTDTINGSIDSVYACTSTGIIAIQPNTAYGTFEFDVLKGGDANTINIAFMSDRIAQVGNGTFNGYYFQIRSTENIRLARNDFGGSATAIFQTIDSYVNNNQWYHVTMTNEEDGTKTIWVDGTLVDVTGGSGTNPVLDNTYTSSNWLVLDLDVGDKVANIVIKSD